MKIKEEFIDGEGDTFHVKRTYDPTPTLERVRQMRSHGVQDLGESRHVGTVPGWLIAEWCKEAGVSYSDSNARNEIIRKKLMSGEFSALRNWQGAF
jgi:hypothetical protein